MERTIAVALLVFLPTLASGQATAARAGTGRSQRIEAEVRQLSDEEVRALMANDVKAAARLWSDDFVVTNPLNKFVTKQEVLGMISSGTLAFASYERRVEYVRVYTDFVVVAGSETVVWAGKMPNAGQTSPLRFTAVWMRQGGRWREVARHANIVIQQQSQVGQSN
jgi:ketosteroid isomerase-like protein